MKDPLVPVAALLRITPPDTYDAAQAVARLHDGYPPNGEYLCFFITLWHVCRLFQHVAGLPPVLDFTSSTRHHPSWLSLRTFDADSVPEFPFLECLASAWLSHPKHVFVLTSPRDQVRLCNSIRVPDAALAATRAYMGDVQDTGGGGDDGGNERILAWFLDAYDGPSDVFGDGGGLGLGGWNVGHGDNGSTIVVIRMDRTITDSVFLLHGHGHGLDGAPNLDGCPDPFPSSQGPRAARDARSWKPAVLQDPHEARGVGVIIKALVQQNAGASLLLRTIVCVASLLCFAHSILVLGERPSFVG